MRHSDRQFLRPGKSEKLMRRSINRFDEPVCHRAGQRSLRAVEFACGNPELGTMDFVPFHRERDTGRLVRGGHQFVKLRISEGAAAEGGEGEKSECGFHEEIDFSCALGRVSTSGLRGWWTTDFISRVDGRQFRVNRLLKTRFKLIEDTAIGRLDDVLAIRSFGVVHYVLRHPDGLYLIDTGFIGAIRAMKRALEIKEWDSRPIRGILLTHGHLDHVLNAAAIARKHGAWIAGPQGDRDRYLGRPRCSGLNRVAGGLERLGRKMLRFEPFSPDRWVENGEEFPLLGGLRAVHLPGHTAGHTGYFCESRRLLFCGDLFASYGQLSHRPPAIFNEDSAMARASIGKALSLDPGGVLPHHCLQGSPERHLEQLMRLGGVAT
jgi:glyoxylase-like metal-dependent hydrolase (beta-lactamase superfamily II)